MISKWSKNLLQLNLLTIIFFVFLDLYNKQTHSPTLFIERLIDKNIINLFLMLLVVSFNHIKPTHFSKALFLFSFFSYVFFQFDLVDLIQNIQLSRLDSPLRYGFIYAGKLYLLLLVLFLVLFDVLYQKLEDKKIVSFIITFPLSLLLFLHLIFLNVSSLNTYDVFLFASHFLVISLPIFLITIENATESEKKHCLYYLSVLLLLLLITNNAVYENTPSVFLDTTTGILVYTITVSLFLSNELAESNKKYIFIYLPAFSYLVLYGLVLREVVYLYLLINLWVILLIGLSKVIKQSSV